MENAKLNPQIAALKDNFIAGKIVPDLQIAEAAMTILDDYRWRPEPTVPDKVKEFNAKTPDQKRKMNDHPQDFNNYWLDDVVKKYYDQRDIVRHLNDRNRDFLKWMKEILGGEQPAIDLKLHQFTDGYQELVEQPQWSD